MPMREQPSGQEKGGGAPGEPGSSTSLSLLARIRAHDEDAWQRLLVLYTPLVLYWCHQRQVRGHDAEDVVQEVFRAAAVGVATFRRDRPGDTFRGWLRGITRNKLLDHLRRLGRQPEPGGGTDAFQRLQELPSPGADSCETEDDDPPDRVSELYHRALELVRGEFEERTWTAFWRASIDGHAPADIAADMGVTPAAVRKAKSRVLHRLKEAVGDLID